MGHLCQLTIYSGIKWCSFGINPIAMVRLYCSGIKTKAEPP